MGADGGVDVVIAVSQSGSRPGGHETASGVHQQSDALLRKGGQKRFPVGVKGAVVHMGVGVKQHKLSLQ